MFFSLSAEKRKKKYTFFPLCTKWEWKNNILPSKIFIIETYDGIRKDECGVSLNVKVYNWNTHDRQTSQQPVVDNTQSASTTPTWMSGATWSWKVVAGLWSNVATAMRARDFSGNWTQYKFGFGERVRGEFWLGNYNIHKMANPCQPNELAITIHRKTQYAMEEFVFFYTYFYLENEISRYRLSDFKGD